MISEHGSNLLKEFNASVIFIEDEQGAKKIPARKHVIFGIQYVTATDDKTKQSILDKFESKIYESYEVARMLADFSLYKFTLHKVYVIQWSLVFL